MPNLQAINAIEQQISVMGATIAAMEDWAPTYLEHPETHAAIIQVETDLAKSMRGYFRGMADRVSGYINWNQYNTEIIKAYEVNVIVSDDALEPEVAILMQAMYDPLESGVVIGAQAAEGIYKIPIGAGAGNEAVMVAARNYIANLVKLNGKQSLVVSTRNKIRTSILTSLQLGETQEQATARLLEKVIKNPVRAAMIARTEAVNAYSQGTLTYGEQTNATKKAWVSSSGPCVICQENIKAGEIAFSDLFPSGHPGPSCHPNDRCGLRLIHDYNAPIDIAY